MLTSWEIISVSSVSSVWDKKRAHRGHGWTRISVGRIRAHRKHGKHRRTAGSSFFPWVPWVLCEIRKAHRGHRLTQIIARVSRWVWGKISHSPKKVWKMLGNSPRKVCLCCDYSPKKSNAPTILHTVDYEVAFVKGHAAILERTQKTAKTRGLCCCKMIFLAYFNPNKAKYLIEIFTFFYFLLEIKQKSAIFAANMF